MRRTAGRLGMPILSAVLVLGGVTAIPATQAAGQPAIGQRAPSDVELDRPARGADAVRLLDDRLDDAAALNGMSAADLEDLLTTDRSAWVDTAGAVFFTDGTADAPANDPVSAAAPLDQTFLLHSKPGTTKTIFLDFDGGTASATGWHATYPSTPTTQPAWDPSGNGAAFTDSELTSIQTIWAAVAEDYAPFDVDVTTADPGPAGIHRSGSGDTAYGSHVLITPSSAAANAICGGGCGGVAYIGVFGAANLDAGGDGYGYRQPAWVFPQALGNSPKNIAEAASHEVGHNFGLRHDANATQSYDAGHGAWAPIMGVGYSRPISQWSKGDYAGATNQEDDVAKIRAVVGDRVDEAPEGIGQNPPVPAGTVYVTSRTDVDTYALGACSGPVTIAANPLASLANLDIELTLRDALGQVVATADPPSGQTSTSVASGVGASITSTLDTGTYFVSVDGVGNGPWTTGYDDYGSMGAYTLVATGCAGIPPIATTTDLVASATGRYVTLTASPTTSLGSLFGDVVFREGDTVLGTTTLGVASPTLTLSSVAPGTHTYTATFVPLGATHLGSVSPTRSATVRVGSTTGLTAELTGRDVTLDVQVATDGGAPAGTVEYRDGDVLVGTRNLVLGAASLSIASVSPGDHAYQATFVPADPSSYAGSSSPVRTLSIAPEPTPTPAASPAPSPTTTAPVPVTPVSSSTTTLKAPRKAKAGSRPTVTVTVVRGTTPAAGTVVVTVGKWSKKLTLKSGSAKVRLPRLTGTRAKVTARYRGDATTSVSTAKRTIKVTG